MAFFESHFFSEALGMSVSANVIIPQATSGQIGMKGKTVGARHPCLYLLHGMSDDQSIWMRRTSIERYAAEYGLAVVMPNVNRSYYTDMASGLKYFTYIAEELPVLMEQFFAISNEREDRFIAGLSMGGYGAWKVGLNKPDQYAAAASLSGVVDICSWMNAESQEQKWIFGVDQAVKATTHDCLHLIQQLVKTGKPIPKLYQNCGTEDFLYANNVLVRDQIKDLKIDYTYKEAAGVHNWAYWDEHIQDVLAWLPLRKPLA